MAIAATTVFETNASATAGNVNGGGFNSGNANFLTDGAATSATGNSPVFTSASYNFVAGDVGHWLYIKSGSNWTPGYYQIASVASNAATLSAAIGQANIVTNLNWGTNSSAGCATTGSPTSATWGMDYSRSTATRQSFSNLGSANGSTTLTDNSTGSLFTKVMVGNLICLSSGTNTTVAWYEIVSWTDANNVVLDVTPHGANTMSATVGKVGGAISLNGSTAGITDSSFFNLGTSSVSAASRFFISTGSYTAALAITNTTAGNNKAPSIIEGYNAIRGDRPAGSTRPNINMQAFQFQQNSNYQQTWGLNFTGTAANIAFDGSGSGGGWWVNCKATNSSSTAGRNAFAGVANQSSLFINCEGICYRGNAFSIVGDNQLLYCNAHASNIGINQSGAPTTIKGCIVWDNVTDAILIGATTQFLNITDNTLYGAENKLGIGINLAAGSELVTVINNIIYGFATGVTHADTQYRGYDDFNNYYNNTADVSATTQWQKGPHDIAVNPTFTNVNQRTGTTATTTAGNHLVQTGATFQTWGITAGTDCIYVSSGTGVTAGFYGILSVDSETQITTDIAITANATADKHWQICQARDFSVGSALKNTAAPGAFSGSLGTNKAAIGALSPAYINQNSRIFGRF